MDMVSGSSEIVESTDEKADTSVPKLGYGYSLEDDINRLFESISVRGSAKGFGPSHGGGKEILPKKAAMKRPIRAGSPRSTGIGISEPVSLKQALRGLSISQASEVAAMKRLTRLAGSSGASEAGTIKRLYRAAVVVEANGSSLPSDEGKGNLVEFSLVPERISSVSPDNRCKSSQLDKVESSDQSANGSHDHVNCAATHNVSEISIPKSAALNTMDSSSSVNHANLGVKKVNLMASSPVEVLGKNSLHDEKRIHAAISPASSLVRPFTCSSPSFIKPIFRNRNSKKKVKQDSSTNSNCCTSSNDKVENSLNLVSKDSFSCASNHSLGSIREDGGDYSPESTCMDQGVEVTSIRPDTYSFSTISGSIGRPRSVLEKIDERSRVKERGELSQSSKSSIGEYSSSTSVSEDSNLSGSSRCGNRPHMSRDFRWEAIRLIQKQHGSFGLKHFKLVRKLGCGDIGSVYLAELTGTNCLFALKVMDNEFFTSRKMSRARTEKEILQMLDHPFLPTLYAHFVSDKLSCLVMEYCPGGDLHVLRQKQPGRYFSEQAVRFYAAEVLLAIEYLHMLGVVYRDLKPENVLVREDGHIMISDFDLSLQCSVKPVVVQSSYPVVDPMRKMSSPCSESSCIEPFCFHPAWQVSCFTPRLLSIASKSRKLKPVLAAQMMSPLPQLVVEPTSARSNSFVGTYEYLAPEIIKGEGHGSAVDWWTFGIFVFELLYGKTPFKGSGNEETLSNVVSQSLRFPSSPVVGFHARDLIRRLLVKEPEIRLGSGKGAAEIKQHSFFDGLNWALIRCAVPPELPKHPDTGIGAANSFSQSKDNGKCEEFTGTEVDTDFVMF